MLPPFRAFIVDMRWIDCFHNENINFTHRTLAVSGFVDLCTSATLITLLQEIGFEFHFPISSEASQSCR